MSFVGGNLLEVKIDHEVEGSVIIKCKASEDNTFDLGGIVANDDQSMVTGSGESITSLNMEQWRAKMTAAWDMNVGLELQKIKRIAASPIEAVITISHINNSIYRGKGRPVGTIEANVNNATFPLVLGGGGELSKLA